MPRLSLVTLSIGAALALSIAGGPVSAHVNPLVPLFDAPLPVDRPAGLALGGAVSVLLAPGS